MIAVEQRKMWRPDDHPLGPQRGDCVAACVASIFEVPYEECAEIDGTSTGVYDWVRDRYPGVTSLTRMLGDGWKTGEKLGDHVTWPTDHFEQGYWMAAIWSPRIPDQEMRGCGCVSKVAGGDPECEWCHGKPDQRHLGIGWGLHAVVMKGRELVWDPHPARDPDAPLYFRQATTWLVVDPSKLVSRCRRGACGEGLIDPDDCYHRGTGGGSV